MARGSSKKKRPLVRNGRFFLLDKMILIWYLFGMKLIKRDTDYAIRAVCYAVKQGSGIVTVPELVKALKIPRPFLRRILQTLTKTGAIRSYRGLGGGFEFSAGIKKKRLVDLIEACQGDIKINECLFKKALCPNRSSCLLKKRMEKIEAYIRKELSSITIDELIRKG